MPVAILMIRTELKNHVSDCYFCVTLIKGITTKSKHTTQNPNLSSTNSPILHSGELPVPKHPHRSENKDFNPVIILSQRDEVFETVIKLSTSKEPHLFFIRFFLLSYLILKNL